MAKKKAKQRRDSLIHPDRFRGTEREDRPVVRDLLEYLQALKQSGKAKELNERNRKAWTVAGFADWAEERFKEIARKAGMEWTGDFRITEERPLSDDLFERDFRDAAFSLHAARDSNERGNVENAACHFLNLGIRLGWCDARLHSRLSRKAKGRTTKMEHWFRAFDKAYERFMKSEERGVSFSFDALNSHLKRPPKGKRGTRQNRFTDWKRARGL